MTTQHGRRLSVAGGGRPPILSHPWSPDVTTNPQTEAVTVDAQTIHATVSGQPDIENKFGPGKIRPDRVRISYRGQHIDARVDGWWVRETGVLTTERLDQHYAVRDATDIVQWPDWLCALATLLRPAVSVPAPAPTDRAAILREAADAIDATREPFPIAVQNGITWATAELRRAAAASGSGRVADETQAERAHRCGNCEGVDPGTCLRNPNRAVVSQPDGEA